jgi:hypothetical protein
MLTPRKWQSPLIAAALMLLVVCGVSHAAPATVAVLNDGGAVPAAHSNFDDSGWQFTNASPIAITALGLWANGGLVTAHQVSIYNLSGVLQVSAVVPTGLTPDAQGYVYASLGTPFALPAGTWIVAASYAQSSPDLMRVFGSPASSVVMSSPLTFGSAFIWFNTVTPVNPNNPGPGNGTFSSSTAAAYFGPNFQFTVPSPPSVVPAPASGLLILIGFGVLSIWCFARRAPLQESSHGC